MSDTFEEGDQSDDCNIICPYCGHSRKAEPCDGDADECRTEEDCYECKKTFVRYAEISVTFHTEPKEDVA